jgi:hypothetical protein
LALLDPNPDLYADPDPADRNECGSGSATLEEGSRITRFEVKVFCTVLYLPYRGIVLYCNVSQILINKISLPLAELALVYTGIFVRAIEFTALVNDGIFCIISFSS